MPFKFKDEKQLVEFVVGAKLPDWQAKLFNKNAEAVQVHSQGEIFYKLNALFPNEHPDSQQHRILAFESVTSASFGRAANNVNRIFKNSSYTAEASEKTLLFANEHVNEGQNLYSWFLDEWVKIALKIDPNARIVVYPPEYYQDKKARCVFVESKYIKHMSPEAFIFISEEESRVEFEIQEMAVCHKIFYDESIGRHNAKLEQSQKNTYTPKLKENIKKHVFHAFFKGDGLYRIEQLEQAGKEYEISHFPIDGEIPVTDVGGEKQKNDINKSFLDPFVQFGNLALLQHSQHTAVNFVYSFPRMSEIQTPCDQDGCQDGWILLEVPTTDYPDGKKKCGKCRGSGYTRNQTPYKTYVKQLNPNAMEGDNKHLDVDEVKYYTPDVSILDYSKSEWRDYLEMAETAVYISQRVRTGNVEAAKSKEIDREDLYSFLSRVGQTYFSRLRFVLQQLERFVAKTKDTVSVQTPYSYAILSEGEAFSALKDILSSVVPVMLKASQVESFIAKFVSQSSPIRKFIDVLKIADPLLYYTNAEISGFKANMIVSPEMYANHVYSYPTLQNMFFQDKDLFLQDTKSIVDKLLIELQKYKPAPEPDLKTKLLGNEPQ